MNKVNIVFFDGFCNICDSFVSTLLLIDTKRRLKFASIQGETAKEYLFEDKETVTFYKSTGERYERSDAVLEILALILPFMSCFFIFIKLILPKKIRDFFYNLIAKNRYHFFGKKETCRMPTEEEKSYFLP